MSPVETMWEWSGPEREMLQPRRPVGGGNVAGDANDAEGVFISSGRGVGAFCADLFGYLRPSFLCLVLVL